MAEIRTYSQTLKIENEFVDGDTRIINVKDPKTNIAQEDIIELQTFMQANNIIIGDKTGATFGRIKKATVVTKDNLHIGIE